MSRRVYSALLLLATVAPGLLQGQMALPPSLARLEPDSRVLITANGRMYDSRLVRTSGDTVILTTVSLGITAVDSVWVWRRGPTPAPIIVGALGGVALSLLFSGHECSIWACRNNGPDAGDVAKWAAIGSAVGLTASLKPGWRLIYAR